ncbi:MAG: hypothetical protein ACLSWS_22255, partial [Faecalispora jeddahensis]
MKKWFACIMCFVMMLGLVACGEDANVEIPDEVSGKNDSSAEYVINLASTSLPGQAPTMAEEDFIAEVEEKSGGRFEFVVHNSSSLGTDEDIL